jgi:UDP:flavonoid glycosyltransferase YjiC (YdhE family)
MPTALLAWELGAGLGHLMQLRRMASRLAPHGMRFVAVVKEPQSAQMLAADGVEILSAPPWPLAFIDEKQRAALSSGTLGDMLAGYGLADEWALRVLLMTWDRVFASIRPDLVIADYSPAAALAAKGRVPLMLVGNGFTLPPAEMPSFPLLHHVSPPQWPEAKVLHVVNTALRAIASPPLERLPQIFEADARSVQTFALLDPYHHQRRVPVEGPLIDRAPAAREENAGTVFAYLRQHSSLQPSVAEALVPFAERLRIFGPGVSAEAIAALARRGAQVETAPPPLASALASVRLFIHLGGLNAACEAIAAGVPQLVLSVDIEKDLIGQAIEQAAIGRLIKIHDPAAKVSPEFIAGMVQDDGLAARAAEVGASHRELLRQSDALGKFERECRELMGRS